MPPHDCSYSEHYSLMSGEGLRDSCQPVLYKAPKMVALMPRSHTRLQAGREPRVFG